jgi:hypothetical protein
MAHITILLKGVLKKVHPPVILALVFFLLQNSILAQASATDIRGSTSLFGQLYGIEVLGITLNYNINHRISVNGGIGVGPTYHVGASYYLNRKPGKKTSFYVGTQAGSVREVLFFDGFGDSQLAVYIPIGFEYMAVKGFTIQVDLGPNFTEVDWEQANTLPFYGSLKIGYTFKKRP